MEESFEFLSSMSPKVKGRQKHFRKGATLLALKKHLRRSSVYDKSVHTINNEELVIIEGNSTDTNSSSTSKQKLLNKSIIIISDTDFSDIDSASDLISFKKGNRKVQKQEKLKKDKTSTNKKQSPVKSGSLSKVKLNDIKQWIDTVNMEYKIKQDITTYNDLSTIYGNEIGGNFKPEGLGHAVNSTLVKSDCMRFDQMFENVKLSNIKTNEETDLKINEDELIDINNSFNDLIIEESFVDLNESLNTRLKYRKDPNKEINMKSEDKKLITSIEDQTANDIGDDKDLVSMLDDLYGDKWREKEECVLPKTEPRKKLPRPHDVHITYTDQKPKLSILYKNPYIETEKAKSYDLLRNLHKTRANLYLESPLPKKLNDLCDSETNSESSGKILKPRMKLNFEDDSDSEFGGHPHLLSAGKTSQYFKKVHASLNELSPKNELNKENLFGVFCSGNNPKEIVQKKNSKNTAPEENKNNTGKGKSNPKDELDNAQESRKKKISKKTNAISLSEKSKPTKKTNEFHSTSSSPISSEDEWEKEISKIIPEKKVINGKYSFLASLSANVPILQCDMLARIHRNNFKNTKDQLLKQLFKLYNESVFDDAIPNDTEIEWNDRMRGTAGYCYCKKITRRTGAVERTARIVLSTKVIDAAYRLRDTLIHEMCHAATWIVNCVSDGHGPYWKAWAYKAMKTFPELPPIKRCHEYTINTKYTYKCTGCGYSIGRHSKSLDIERKRCGYCLGKFEVLLNKISKKGEIKSVPATPKKEATGFALFVKENYGIYKNAHYKHGDVMKILGQKFQEMKVNKI